MKYHKDMPKLIQEAMAELGFKISVAQKIGITYDQLREWEKGNIPQTFLNGYPTEEHERLKTEVSEAIKKGEEEFIGKIEVKCVGDIIKDDSWQSKAWFLERRIPERYAKQEKLDMNANNHFDEIIFNIKYL